MKKPSLTPDGNKRCHSVIMLGGPKPRTHTAEDFYKAVQSAREDSHLFHDTSHISE